MKIIKIHCGNSLDVLKTFPSNSVDAVVTDPPYGLSFMGKKWDCQVPDQKIWEECLRVVKHGGYLLSFAGTRTQHRMAVRIEDAGFEIRDVIAWVYGSGFPKSLNIGKAVDNLLGNERKFMGGEPKPKEFSGKFDQRASEDREKSLGNGKHEGWGTALKPAFEPITMARKPLAENTVAENVMAWGTGGINIDGCRVEADNLAKLQKNWNRIQSKSQGIASTGIKAIDLSKNAPTGRFPANFIHDGSEEVLAIFPDTTPSKAGIRRPNKKQSTNAFGDYNAQPDTIAGHEDAGGSASRFFYCPKASKQDREEGLDGFESKDSTKQFREGTDPSYICADGYSRTTATPQSKNNHPTVKPVDLMRYLCRLVTPTGGIILDPFMGSGSTGKAAALEGFDFIGIDLDENYCKISEARINEAIKVYELARSHDEHHNRLRFIHRNSDGVLSPNGYPNNPQPEPNSRVNFYPSKLAKRISYTEGFRQLELF
jgi:site-specific DNA-methyltransferase (adenine-specific)